MEQILIYLAIAFIAVLLVILAIVLYKWNNAKAENIYSAERLAYEEKENINLEKRLSEYEKTNVLQIKEINELNEECDRYLTSSNGYKMKCNELQDDLYNKTVFINALNERLQKAEAERDVFKKSYNDLLSENSKLVREQFELQSKLSRKGLGKKGRKKNESFAYDYKTEILKRA